MVQAAPGAGTGAGLKKAPDLGKKQAEVIEPMNKGLQSFEQRRAKIKAAQSQLQDWYGSWATWQRHGLLCGIAKRCSPAQTQYLLSSLEPVFHRDYMITAAGEYPWKWIGKGRKPQPLEKADKNRYKKSRLLNLARQRLKDKPSHLENHKHQPESSRPPSQVDIRETASMSTKKKVSLGGPAARKDSTASSVGSRKISQPGVGSQPVRKDSTASTPSFRKDSIRSSQGSITGGGGISAPATILKTGRKSWIKLKTVQLLDPSPIIGDKDRGLALREQLVDGLGIWNGSQLRRSLPLPLAQHKHFFIKSAGLQRLQQQQSAAALMRENTKSSYSFRTENIYTPQTAEGQVPKTKEDIKLQKEEYKMQIKTVNDWLQSLTDAEMGEVLGTLLLTTSSPDLRFLTSCLVSRSNDKYGMGELTDSLMLQILQYLPPEDLLNTAQVSTRLRYLSDLDLLWKRHCIELGEVCGLNTIKELIEAFQLDEDLGLSSTDGGGHGGGGGGGASLSEVETWIDWKLAYQQLSAAVDEAEASLQLEQEQERMRLALISPNLDDTPRPSIKDMTLSEAIKRTLPLILEEETGEDRWLRNYMRASHELYPEEQELASPPSTTLTDLYDIHSLMGKEDKWKINLDTGQFAAGPASPQGTESIYDAIADEMNQPPKEDDEEGEEETLITQEESNADVPLAFYEPDPEKMLLREDTVSPFRASTMFSFERAEIDEWKQKKMQEELERLKRKKTHVKKLAQLLESGADPSALADVPAGVLESLESLSAMGTDIAQAVGSILGASAGSGTADATEKPGQSAEAGKEGATAEGKKSEVETKVEVASVSTFDASMDLNDSQYSAKFRSRLGRRRHGELQDQLYQGVDVRPPALQPKDIMPQNANHFSVKWKYPKQFDNPFLGAKYQNRIMKIKNVKILQGHMDSVLCFKLGRRRLMSGSLDQSIRVWSTASGKCLHKMYGHKGSVSALDFNDEWIVSGSWDMSLMVWSSLNYRHLTTLYGHLQKITSVIIAQSLVYSSSHDSTIRVWSIEREWACVKVIQSCSPISRLMLTGPDECIFSSTDGKIRILDLESEKLEELQGHRCEASAFKVSGDLIISASLDGEVRFWNKSSLSCESGILAHPEKPIFDLDFHRRKFYTASSDSTVREWDLYTMTCMRVLHGHKAAVTQLKVSDSRIVTSSVDGEIRFWELFDPLEKL